MPDPETPSSGKNTSERIESLRSLLRRANRAYYADASPIMSDREYDDLLAELADLEAQHPELDAPDSPTKRVGGEPIEGFETVAHAVPMLSIDNTYSADEVRAWIARVHKSLGRADDEDGDDSGLFAPSAPDDGTRFVCEPKIDGVALSLRYEEGRLVRALTRGDGEKGDDVSHAARTIRAIPLRLQGEAAPPEVLEIRGEVFIPRPEFERINAEREAGGLDPFMNPRNACAGTIKQLDPKAIAERRLRFIAHGRGAVSDGFAASYSEFRERIAAMGVPVSPHAIEASDADGILDAIESFERERHALDAAAPVRHPHGRQGGRRAPRAGGRHRM